MQWQRAMLTSWSAHLFAEEGPSDVVNGSKVWDILYETSVDLVQARARMAELEAEVSELKKEKDKQQYQSSSWSERYFGTPSWGGHQGSSSNAMNSSLRGGDGRINERGNVEYSTGHNEGSRHHTHDNVQTETRNHDLESGKDEHAIEMDDDAYNRLLQTGGVIVGTSCCFSLNCAYLTRSDITIIHVCRIYYTL